MTTRNSKGLWLDADGDNKKTAKDYIWTQMGQLATVNSDQNMTCDLWLKPDATKDCKWTTEHPQFN